MSVITTYEPVPNRIRTLARVVAAAGPLARDELAEHLMPGSPPKQDQVANILREAVRLRIVTETDRKVELAEGIRPRDVADDAWFEAFVGQALFSRILDERDDNRAVGFAMAWLLTRPAVPELEWRSDFAAAMRADLHGDEVYDATNVDRSAMLAYWARFAGLAEAVGWSGKRYLVPDPTRAIARQLEHVLPLGSDIPMPRFLDGLAAVLAVLEGGAIRAQVESRLRRPREAAALSAATSLALLRLELRGAITLRAESDASPYLRLLEAGGDSPRRVTHISRPRLRK